ncbi:MAG: hypothetical protein M3275_02290 [Thermoproteota archaeon]|nr:hypothetical protein [Thermoproteota archaeon]
MSERATKRYEETKNKSSEAMGDDQIPESVYDFTKPDVHIKAVDLKDRDDFDIMGSDYTSESIAKENSPSTRNKEAKLRSISDREC